MGVDIEARAREIAYTPVPPMDKQHLIAAFAREIAEECARIADGGGDGFSWSLPMHESREINEATDDAACAVTEQVAHAIRTRFNLKESDRG